MTAKFVTVWNCAWYIILETGSGLVYKCVHTADGTRQNCLVLNIEDY